MYTCVAGNQIPREVLQWLSMARHIINNEVFVVTISQFINPKPVNDTIETDPVYINLVNNYNTELLNISHAALECFATDAGKVLKADTHGFSAKVMRLAERTELHHALGMKYEKIEAISANKAEFLRQKVASQAAITNEMLCIEKYYFDRLFLNEVEEE
jgi:hypothetical protein